MADAMLAGLPRLVRVADETRWRGGAAASLAGAALLLQGLAEIARCVICLRQGAWPSREADVEEVDVEKLKEMVHVTDADRAAIAVQPPRPSPPSPGHADHGHTDRGA